MAKGFNLTAQINLRGPTNLKPVVADIRRQLGTISSDINVRLNPQAAKSVNEVTKRLKSMNDMLMTAKNSSDALGSSLSNLSSSLSGVGNVSSKSASGILKTSNNAKTAAQNIKTASTEMEAFGKQSFLAIRRFAAFSIVSGAIYKLVNAINTGFNAFVNFDKQLVKLQQVTGKGAIGLKNLENQITNLATSLGVSSESLIDIASTLAQAGLNAEETRIALSALAKTELAPSFDNLKDTTEGAIAALRQFELQAGDLEAALGSINAVAAAFAVESSDIITAIQRTGGVFAAASKGVSEGKDALNEFIAVFTSVRATTRESAETIATGLRTIFTRIQRGKTIEALKEYGVILTDLEDKFVGPYEAVKRLSEGLKLLDPRDLRFSQIVEELGGFRQIGKVIPLIQQFSEAQKALRIAQTGQSSLTDAQVIAQKSLANQIVKVREQFLALIRDIGKSGTFQAITKIVLNLASAFINLAGAFKPILPFLAILGTIKGVKALGEFGTGFFGGLKGTGGGSTAKNVGTNIGSTISGSKEKEKAATTKLATDAIQANTSALKSLTSAVSSLENTIKSRGASTLSNGGRILGFNSGGIVPGSGKGDKIPALLEPGEVVINNKAANKYGRGNLVRMNKYDLGGPVDLTGKEISKTYSSLKNKIKLDKSYFANIQTIPESTVSIKPRMEKIREQYPTYPNWKLFEYAVAQKRGLKLAGGNKFLDYPGVLGEAKFLPPDATYSQDKETGFIKGNNNETMLAKLVGSGLYKQNATIRAYYPDKISDYRNFLNGGIIKKFKNGEYVEGSALQALKELTKDFLTPRSRKGGQRKISFLGQKAVSISKNISPTLLQQIEEEGRLVYGTGIGDLPKGDPGLIVDKIINIALAKTKNKKAGQLKKTQGALTFSAAGLQRGPRAPAGQMEKTLARYQQDPEYLKSIGIGEDNTGESLLNILKNPLSNFRQSGGKSNLAGVFPGASAAKIKAAIPKYIASLSEDETQKITKAKTALQYFDAFISGGTAAKPGHATAFTETVNQILKSGLVQSFAKGGLIQKFMNGGITETLNPEQLLTWIKELGNPQDIRGLVGGNSFIDKVLKEVETKDRPVSAKEIFSKNFILGNRSGPYLPKIQELLEIADKNKKRPRIFTEKEKSNAIKVGLVGMLPFGVNDTHYEEIAGKILSIHTATLPKDKVPAVLQMRKEIDEVLGRTTKNLYGDSGQNLDDPTKEALGLGNLEGYMIEAILARAGANPGKLDDRSVDYQMGLGKAAGLFGIEPDIPTEIKRDVKSGLSKARANFRNYFSKFAFGGKADGPGFEDIKKQIIDKYPDIDFRISKRKQGRGFGYNLLGALKTDGGLLGSKRLKFEQPSNLQKLVETADSMASDLINPKKFAGGGTVPAMVSSGEAFIPPKLAKKIGYGKLHKMNQADRNGMKGFSGGGISVFKGPGSGTSDSIGPIGLPEGSFIIREKATKALGLNKGGIVGGIKRFFRGGQSEKDAVRAQGEILSSIEQGSNIFYEIMGQLPSQIKDIILSKFQGVQNVKPGESISMVPGSPSFTERTRGMAAASTTASAIGLQITGKKGGATTETVAHETGHLADIALGGGTGFASEMKGTFQFELINKIKKQMEDAFKKAGKSAEEIDKYLATGQELFAEFFAKASPEVRTIITSTTDAKVGMEKLVDALGETGFTYAGLEASDLMPSKPKKPKQKDEFSYLKQQSKAIEAAKSGAVSFESLKPRTKTRKEVKQQLDDSGLKALTSGIAQTSGEIAKLKAQTESLYQQSKNLDNQISQYDQAILKIRSSTEEGAKGNKALNRIIQMKISAETQRLSVDKQAMTAEEQLTTLTKQKAQQIAAAKTFKTTGGGDGTGPTGPSGPTLPKIDTTGKNPYADEKAFIQYKARKEGMGEGEYRRSLATKIADTATSLQRDYGGRKEEFKQSLVARRESFQGIDKSTDVGQAQFNTAVAELAKEIQDLNPELKFEQAKAAAEKLANDLAVTGDQAKDVGSLMGELSNVLPGEIDATKALELAKKQVAKQEGMSAGTLGRAVNAKEIQREQFIRSPEGQRFGRLAEFAPGLTQKFAGTKVGQALGKGADFISGKGGRFSKLFAGAGGFQGIGSGIAVGSEMLKTSGLIDKQTLKNPNVAGAFGAVQGAGVMGATGAELGGQLAGPIGALVGGIGGAVIGGIKGFFDAKNAQILGNALDKLTKSSEAVDIAFKELAKNDTDKNFKNVQKAFGQQIEASKELDAIAFGGGEGPSVGGVGGGALAGAAGGALIGSFIPVIGTAIGAALGAVVGGGVAYLSEGQNKANREEALRNRVGSAGAMNETAARMAERQRGRMTNEQLEVSKQSGINLIAQQYKESAIAAAEANSKTGALTAKQKEKIGQDAMETAALDAYMKQRKEAGATDQQITDDILADRKSALQAGKQALDAQEAAAQKQEELARATKQVAVATESLLDVYRRVGAKAQRFSDEVDDMLSGTQSTIASLGGNAAVQKVDRSGSERVLGNISAYSRQEVEAATQEVVGKLGGGEEAQALGKQAQAAKFLQDRLPGLLKNDNVNVTNVMSEIRGELGNMGLTSGPINTMLDEIEKQIEKGQESGLGTLADEISAGGIDKFSMTAAEAAKTLQNLSKTYNDTLQKSIDLQNQYNETIMKSNEYSRKAGSIRINAELDLAKALGNSPTLAQLNEPFDFEIKDLTKGLVPGGTIDPAAIAAGITAKTAENQQLEAANANIGNVGMQGATGGARAQLLAEQQKNIAAIGANNVAINEGRQALERLATDGTKAANALAKIEEQQRQIEGLGNRFEKIFTASPEELFKMNRQSDALALAQVAGPEQFKSRAFRQDAFAGLEQDKEFLTGEEYRKQRGMLIRKSLESQGKTGESIIEKGGVSMTVDEFIKRIEGGISEEDPNVKAYREAVATQIQANEKLAMLEELKSVQIQEAMLGLQVFLANEFPKILIDAVKASREDAETKPETSSKPEKSKEQKQAELDFGIAETNIKNSKEIITGLDKKIKNTKDPKELERLQSERYAEQSSMYDQLGNSIAARAIISQEQSKAKAKEEETKSAQAAEEKKAKEAKVSSSIEQSQRARNYDRPRVIEAPPAPGTREAQRAELNIQREIIERRLAEAQTQPTTTNEIKPVTQTTATVYGSTKPTTTSQITKEEMQILDQLPSIKDMQAFKTQKEAEIVKLEKQVKVARASAEAAGTEGSKSQEYLASKEAALASAKGDLNQLDTSISAKQAAEAQKRAKEEGKKQAQIAQSISPKTGTGSERYADQFRNSMAIQPIQSNLPKPVEYTRQVQAAETGTTTQTSAKPTETTAQLLTLDPTSLEGLNTFNTNFGSYVDKLVNFQFPTIPEKIEMTGTHTVDVRVTGAAAFESLQKNIQNMINKEIDTKMAQIWQQTGGQIGTRPGTPPTTGK